MAGPRFTQKKDRVMISVKAHSFYVTTRRGEFLFPECALVRLLLLRGLVPLEPPFVSLSLLLFLVREKLRRECIYWWDQLLGKVGVTAVMWLRV